MYSLIEIAHIKAAKAAFEVQLDEMKANHEKELKLAYKAGREDLIKELGLALNEKKSQEHHLDISKIVSERSVAHHIDKDVIQVDHRETKDPLKEDKSNDKLDQVINNPGHNHVKLRSYSSVTSDFDVVSQPNHIDTEPKIATITSKDRKEYWNAYRKLKYWIQKRQAGLERLKRVGLQNSNEFRLLNIELKRSESSMSKLMADWEERKNQTESVESTTTNIVTTTNVVTTPPPPATSNSDMYYNERMLHNRKYANLTRRISLRKARLDALTSRGRQCTPDAKRLAFEIKDLKSARTKLVTDWETRRKELGYKTITTKKGSGPIGEEVSRAMRADPDYLNAKDPKTRAKIYKRIYKRIYNRAVRAGKHKPWSNSPKTSPNTSKSKSNFKSKPGELIREVLNLNEDLIKKKLEEKRARQRLYDQKKAARKKELRDNIEQAKLISLRMSQSAPNIIENPTKQPTRPSTSTANRTISTDQIDLAREHRDSTFKKTRKVINYHSPPTFSLTMNQHQSLINDRFTQNPSSSIGRHSIKDLEAQSQNLSTVVGTSNPKASQNFHLQNGVGNLDQLEQELQTSMPEIKKEYI